MQAFKWFSVGVIVILMLVLLFGCEFVDLRTGEVCANHNAFQCIERPKSESWDQENLKSHDDTCRTMVYHNNPVTHELEQCPPTF